MTSCDDYCNNYGCNQGPNCHARGAKSKSGYTIMGYVSPDKQLVMQWGETDENGVAVYPLELCSEPIKWVVEGHLEDAEFKPGKTDLKLKDAKNAKWCVIGHICKTDNKSTLSQSKQYKPDLRRQKIQAWAIALVSIAAAVVVYLDLFVWRA